MSLLTLVIRLSVLVGMILVTCSLQINSGNVAFSFSHLSSSRFSDPDIETSKEGDATMFSESQDDLLWSKSMMASLRRLEPITISQVEVSLNDPPHDVFRCIRLYQKISPLLLMTSLGLSTISGTVTLPIKTNTL